MKDFIKNIFKANDGLAAAQKSNTDWADKYAVLEKELSTTQDVVGKFMEEKKTFDSQIETLKTSHQKEIDALNLQIASTKESLNKEVTVKLASIGIPEGTVKEESADTTLTPETALAKFKALTGKEKQQFFEKNKSLLHKAARS